MLGLLVEAPERFDVRGVEELLFQSQRSAFAALRAAWERGVVLDLVQAGEVWAQSGFPFGRMLAVQAMEAREGVVFDGLLRHLREYARRRRLWRAGDTLRRIAAEPDEGDPEVIETVLDDVAGIGLERLDETQAMRAAYQVAVAEAAAREPGAVSGLQTGFVGLDDRIGGMHPGELVVLAARTSMGKSALALQIALHVAESGGGVLLCTPEMSRRQVVERLIAQRLRIPTARFRRNTLSSSEAAQLQAYEPPHLLIADNPSMSTGQLSHIARREHRKAPLSLVVVDHLGYLTDPMERGENRATQVGRMTKALKRLAGRLGCVVLCVSQLNRRSEDGTTVTMPSLADLRDSGEIEQDADTVILLHREDRLQAAGPATAIVAKARTGPTGICKLLWSGVTTSFTEAAA